MPTYLDPNGSPINNTTNPGYNQPKTDADTLAGNIYPEGLKSGPGYDSSVTDVGPASRGSVGGTGPVYLDNNGNTKQPGFAPVAVQAASTSTQPVTPTSQPVAPDPVAAQQQAAIQQASTKQTLNDYLNTPTGQTAQALIPNTMSDNPTLWGFVKDIGSLPLRVVGGTGLALGEAGKEALPAIESVAQGGGSIGAQMDPSQIAQTFMSGMAQPSAEAGTGAIPQAAAGMAESPLTLPSMVSGGGLLAQAARFGGANYLSNTLDRMDQGQTIGQALRGESGGQALSDLAPLALAGAGKTLGFVGNRIAAGLGEGGMQQGRNILAKIIGAAPMVNHGAEREGLVEGLKGTLQNKRAVPALVDATTFSAPDVAEKYYNIKSAVDANFDPVFDQLDAAGVTANPRVVLNKASDILDANRAQRRLPITDAQAEKALNWAKNIAGLPENPEVLQVRRAVQAGRQPDLVTFRDTRNGETFQRAPSQFRFGIPDHIQAVRGSEQYRLSDGTYTEKGLFEPTPRLSAKGAHFTKSKMQQEAARSPNNPTAKQEIAGIVGREMKDQLTTNPRVLAELVTPESDLARQARKAYTDQLKAALPLYQMEDAMYRAAHTGANKSILSLRDLVALRMLSNPLTASVGLFGFGQKLPQAALAMDKFGAATVPIENFINSNFVKGLTKDATSLPGRALGYDLALGAGGQPRQSANDGPAQKPKAKTQTKKGK